MRTPTFAAALAALLSALPAQAAPTFINGLTISGSALDQSGGTALNNGRLGFFSDLYYDTHRNEWWGLSDRGPGGGTISYDTRLNRFSLDVNPLTGAISNFAVQQTILFRDGAQTFNGLAPNPSNNLGNAFDPEGMVILPGSGNILVSDEYGPSVIEFARNGQFVRRYEVPANLIPKVGSNVNYNATSSTLTAGRENNRGLEGLAVSPDGRHAFAMLQNGTITDGTFSGGGSFNRSMYTRIIKYDTSTGSVVGQYAYRLDGSGTSPSQGRGISAIVALDANRFMVLERNNRGVGVDANINSPDKKVYIIDLSGATDVSTIPLTGTLPIGTVVASKSADALANLVDSIILNDPSLGALGGRGAEKWEGLTVGPQLSDGSYLLLAGTDNDYSVTQNGTGTQFDVYYNPSDGSRVQCDLGTQVNCTSISTTGALNSTPGDVGNLPASYELIPGVLIGFRASAQDLGGYTPPVAAVPGPLPLAGAMAALAWSRGLRRRLRAHPARR